jgi:multidrug efflux pump subunit AcrA (membrane-fusion protein)
MKILHRPSISVLLLGAIMLISSLISLGCKSKDAHNSAAAQPPPPSVVVASVDQKTVPIYSEFVGQTRADDTVELRARVEGILQKVYFKEGTHDVADENKKTVVTYSSINGSGYGGYGETVLARRAQRTDVLQAQAQLADAQAVLTRADQDVRVLFLSQKKRLLPNKISTLQSLTKSLRKHR